MATLKVSYYQYGRAGIGGNKPDTVLELEDVMECMEKLQKLKPDAYKCVIIDKWKFHEKVIVFERLVDKHWHFTSYKDTDNTPWKDK